MKRRRSTSASTVIAIALLFASILPVSCNHGDTSYFYGSLWAIPNHAVVAASTLRSSPFAVRQAFAAHLVNTCRIFDHVVKISTSSNGKIRENFSARQQQLLLDRDVVAGGFSGRTYITIGFSIRHDNKTSIVMAEDMLTLASSLGYVFTQGSVFLLDANDTSSFDFAAKYLVMVFPNKTDLPLQTFADFFDLVGSVDPQIFNSGGYTQFGNTYLSLQSDAADSQHFMDTYIEAGRQAGVQYTPLLADGKPSLYDGGAAYPYNNWRKQPEGDKYLSQIPFSAHKELFVLREQVLRITHMADTFLSKHALNKNQSLVLDLFSNMTCCEGTDDKVCNYVQNSTEACQSMSCSGGMLMLVGIVFILAALIGIVRVCRCRRRKRQDDHVRYHETGLEVPTLNLDDSELL